MISPRYAAPVAVLLALALVPTVIHSYRGTTVEDGLRAAAVPEVLNGARSEPTPRRPDWVLRNFETGDWTERVYREAGGEVTLFVARSFDAKRLYHHPELALLKGLEPAGAGVARGAARPDVPLHVLTIGRDGRRGVAVYALLYDGRFIDNPIGFQFRTAAELLFSGRRSMTLFMASGLAGDVERLDEAPATRVLLAAIDAFEKQTPVTAGE